MAARPDPETLAARLFEWGLHSEWETFYGAATTFADVLGEGGLAVVRKLAEEVWAPGAAWALGPMSF